MNDIIANVGSLASFIGSLTVVGGALMWIYNKLIGAPRERKREKESAKRQAQMVALITEKNEPLNLAIENLNVLLGESQIDRQQLNKVAEENTRKLGEHETELEEHDRRIFVLETRNGIKSYKEVYEGEGK